MPGTLIERPKMTRVMYHKLKRHILKEREKRKQELDQVAAHERFKKEQEELRKKREHEDSTTLKEIIGQLTETTGKYDKSVNDKHNLFQELKKILEEEKGKDGKRRMIEEQQQLHHAMNPSAVPSPIPTNTLLAPSPFSTPAQLPVGGTMATPIFLQNPAARLNTPTRQSQSSNIFRPPLQQPTPTQNSALKRSRVKSPSPATTGTNVPLSTSMFNNIANNPASYINNGSINASVYAALAAQNALQSTNPAANALYQSLVQQLQRHSVVGNLNNSKSPTNASFASAHPTPSHSHMSPFQTLTDSPELAAKKRLTESVSNMSQASMLQQAQISAYMQQQQQKNSRAMQQLNSLFKGQ